ncbi:MAG: hypothetical protein KBI01_09310 [Oscillospiraceae bacterium]|nr:hypothetical protein [Oscillospiraceae bacterium]
MMSNYFKYRENITIIKEGVQIVRNGCKNPTVREAAILQKIAEPLGTGSFCKDAVGECVEKVVICDGDVQVISKRMQRLAKDGKLVLQGKGAGARYVFKDQ